MELEITSFALGLVVSWVILAAGFILGKMETGTGIREVFKKEKPVLAEDIPGTDEYYEKALLSPEEGGHEHPVDLFEQDIIELNRHSS